MLLDLIFLNLLKCALGIFLFMEDTLFCLGIPCYFLATPGPKVVWSHQGLNPGTSDSQPDAMAICHVDPYFNIFFTS